MAFQLPLLLGIDAIILSSIHIMAEVYAARDYTDNEARHKMITGGDPPFQITIFSTPSSVWINRSARVVVASVSDSTTRQVIS